MPQSTWRDALHILVLCGFAWAQPLYDLLARNGEFFVMRRSGPADILLLILVLSFLAPLTLLLATRLPRLGPAVKFFLLASLPFLIFMQLIRPCPLPGWTLLALAGAAGVAFACSYRRWNAVRLFLSALSPAILIFPAMFLVHPKVHAVVFPSQPSHAASPKAAAPTPVVMLLLDEFPLISLLDENRRIDAERFPNFAALAQDAVWYRQVTTVHPWTQQAVPALLTGDFGKADRLPTTAAYPRNLFTLLAPTHQMHVLEPATDLCPPHLTDAAAESSGARLVSLFTDLALVHLHLWMPRDLSAALPPVNATWKSFTLPEREDRPEMFERFLASLQRGARPGLHFLHVELPHYPWRFLPSGHVHGRGVSLEGLADGVWTDDEDLVERHHLRHLLQVGYADRLLGRLLDKLKAEGLYDDVLLIVTADHGISFRPGDSHRAFTATNAADILRVPLFVKYPGSRDGKIDDRAAQSIDLLPTVADVLALPLDPPAAGRSLRASASPQRPRVVWDKERRWDFSHVDGDFGGLERKTSLLKSQAPMSIAGFAHGLHPELLGRKVDAVWTGAEAELTAELDNPANLTRVDLTSSFVPACLEGQLWGGREDAAPCIAAALNGRICALTRARPSGKGCYRISALTLADAFVQGHNTLDLFEVTAPQPGRSPTLRRILVKNLAAVQWQWDEAAKVLRDPDGREVPIVARSLAGCVDPPIAGPGCVELPGWAADPSTGQPATLVLLFSQGRLVAAQTPREPRPDVSARLADPRSTDCGFRFLLSNDPGAGAAAELRCFAVAPSGKATELRFTNAR